MTTEISELASDAVEHAIRSSTVGIVSGSGEQKWSWNGTGTLIRWKGRHLILTAHHVIEDTLPEDLRFFLPPDSPPIKVERETMSKMPGAPTSLMRPFTQLDLGRIVIDKELDLAAIEVDGNLSVKTPANFFDLAEGGRTPTEGQQTIIMGFPSDISRVTHAGFRVLLSYVMWTQVAPNRKYLRDFDPDIHFLTHYTEAETHPDASPRGISGAAMWFLSNESLSVGYPKLDIAGVGISWYKGQQPVLQIVQREIVEEFLTAKLNRQPAVG